MDAGCRSHLDSLQKNSTRRSSSSTRSHAAEVHGARSLGMDHAWPPERQLPDQARCTAKEQQQQQQFAAELWLQACEAAREEACSGGASSGPEETPSRLDALAAQCLALFERSQQRRDGASWEEPVLAVPSHSGGPPDLAESAGSEGVSSPWLGELVALGNELMQQLEQEGCIGGAGGGDRHLVTAGQETEMSGRSSADLLQHYMQRGKDLHAASAVSAAE